MIPLSLYVHLPWCVSRCPYCDFNAYAANQFDEPRYLEALLQELSRLDDPLGPRPLHSVFFGGGTPSRFHPSSVGQILSAVRARFECTDDFEVTLEANPESASSARFAGYREAGVNRLSLGVQSFEDACLQAIGRAHDSREAQAAIFSARKEFERINLDLMVGLPGQSVAQALTDLQQAIDQGVEHISWYQLTLEPGTPFAARPPVLPADEQIHVMQEQGAVLLERAGFHQYEVSAWHRGQAACRHNLNYWEYGDYFGIGAGAHGKRTDPKGQVVRTRQIRRPQDWMRAALADGGAEKDEPRSAQDQIFEFMLGALRLRAGFAWDLFEARTGQSRHRIKPVLAQARELVEDDGSHLRPSPKGWRYLDDLCELFLPADPVEVSASREVSVPIRYTTRPLHATAA